MEFAFLYAFFPRNDVLVNVQYGTLIGTLLNGGHVRCQYAIVRLKLLVKRQHLAWRMVQLLLRIKIRFFVRYQKSAKARKANAIVAIK